MKQNFIDATKILKIIDDNKKLTDNNYSKQEVDKLAQNVWNTIQPYINDNLDTYKNWDNQDYSQRKKFISDILNLLLERFSSDNQDIPKIYFQEDIRPIWPENISMPAALFYSPDLSPWANNMVKKATGSTKPFFAFFHDLSGRGLLGQITHEFTHYLQSIGKSSLSRDVIQQAAEYYQFYYADKKKNKQIYDDSIHEYEAREIGEYINKQIKQVMTKSNDNVEIKIAKQTIELLKAYASAKTQAEKDDLLQQMDKIDGFVNRLLDKYSPEELITKITKAISLDKYRPKNLAIPLFAINKDLDYVGGDFNTFNAELSKMVNNNEDPEKIRQKFKAGTVNIYILAKQFSADWIQRLNNHKDLVDAARKIGEENFVDAQNCWLDSLTNNNSETIKNPSEEKIIDAYNKLFEALNKDFCNEYDCIIDAKLVKNWETSDIKPNDPTASGYHSKSYSLTFSKGLPESEQEKIKEEFLKDYKNHPNSRRKSDVRVNFSSLAYKNKPEDLFYVLLSIFAHEMHHALDFQHPRQGALGPQIAKIDDKIYVSHEKDEKAYYESATEISSYEIEHELFNQLKNSRF